MRKVHDGAIGKDAIGGIMYILCRRLALVTLIAAALWGCADSGRQGVAPKMSDALTCSTAPDPMQCKLAHDKAGGAPFVFTGSGR